MSLTINIYYTGTNGNARKFAEEMISSGLVDRIRAEEGNEKYEYFFPMEDKETVLLIDRWKDNEALDIDRVFQKMKSKHPNDNKGFGWRAILSSIAGETIDSGIFIPLAFLGTMPINTLLVMIFTQVILKVSYEVVILPLTIYVTKKTQIYENNILKQNQ